MGGCCATREGKASSTISDDKKKQAAHEISDDKKKQAAHEIFTQFDKDSTGSLDATELKGALEAACKMAGAAAPDWTTEQAMGYFDANKDGTLSRAEFETLVMTVIASEKDHGHHRKQDVDIEVDIGSSSSSSGETSDHDDAGDGDGGESK